MLLKIVPFFCWFEFCYLWELNTLELHALFSFGVRLKGLDNSLLRSGFYIQPTGIILNHIIKTSKKESICLDHRKLNMKVTWILIPHSYMYSKVFSCLVFVKKGEINLFSKFINLYRLQYTSV